MATATTTLTNAQIARRAARKKFVNCQQVITHGNIEYAKLDTVILELKRGMCFNTTNLIFNTKWAMPEDGALAQNPYEFPNILGLIANVQLVLNDTHYYHNRSGLEMMVEYRNSIPAGPAIWPDLPTDAAQTKHIFPLRHFMGELELWGLTMWDLRKAKKAELKITFYDIGSLYEDAGDLQIESCDIKVKGHAQRQFVSQLDDLKTLKQLDVKRINPAIRIYKDYHADFHTPETEVVLGKIEEGQSGMLYGWTMFARGLGQGGSKDTENLLDVLEGEIQIKQDDVIIATVGLDELVSVQAERCKGAPVHGVYHMPMAAMKQVFHRYNLANMDGDIEIIGNYISETPARITTQAYGLTQELK